MGYPMEPINSAALLPGSCYASNSLSLVVIFVLPEPHSEWETGNIGLLTCCSLVYYDTFFYSLRLLEALKTH